MSIVNRLASLMWLGILTILFCIPVITAGASITAMYYTVFKMKDRDKGYVTSNFMHAFKSNFLQATAMWLMVLAAYCILYADFSIMKNSGYAFPVAMKVATGVVAIFVVMTSSFLFPLQSRFENRVKQTMKNAFLMSMFHLPRTILIIFLHVVPYMIMYIYPVSFPAVFVLGLSAPAFFNAPMFLDIFSKYAPVVVEQEDDLKWTEGAAEDEAEAPEAQTDSEI